MFFEGRKQAAAGTGVEPSDDELMKRLQQGDTAALGLLYERHRGIVNAVVQRQGSRLSAADAEDTCHEVFLTLLDVCHRFRPGDTLRGWLCGMALKKARRMNDRRRSRAGLLARFFRPAEVAPVSPAPAEAKHDAQSLLEQLPVHLREVAVLTHVEHLSPDEVAAALGISLKTVANRLSQARRAARDVLGREA